MSATCGSCGERIRWVTTTRNAHMPLDPQPSPSGNVILVMVPSFGELRAKVLRKSDMGAGEDGKRYTSHWATCRTREQHRKPRRKDETLELF